MDNLKLDTEKAFEELFQRSTGKIVNLDEFKIPAEISQEFKAAGFSELKKEGNYLITFAAGSYDNIGKMRISWQYYPCKEASIVA